MTRVRILPIAMFPTGWALGIIVSESLQRPGDRGTVAWPGEEGLYLGPTGRGDWGTAWAVHCFGKTPLLVFLSLPPSFPSCPPQPWPWQTVLNTGNFSKCGPPRAWLIG